MKFDLFNFMLNAFKELRMDAEKHMPKILTGLAIGGFGYSTYLAGHGAIKAKKRIDDAEHERALAHWNPELKKFDIDDVDNAVKLTTKEKIKLVYRDFVPCAIVFSASTCCVLKSLSINQRRTAVVASAYKLLEESAREYKEKVIETIGEKKEKQIVESIAEDKIRKNPPESTQVIFTNKGNTLCYETISGRYFKFDIDKIKKIENELNFKLRENNYVSLNELYLELGLDLTDMGYEIGWSVEDGMVDFDYSSKLTKDDEPCMVLGYSRQPKAGYSLFY